MPNCPICNAAAASGERNGTIRISCPKCGGFQLNQETLEDLPPIIRNDTHRALLSHKVNRSQIQNDWPEWNIEKFSRVIAEEVLPSVSDQISGTFEWLCLQSKAFGDRIDTSNQAIEAYAGVPNPQATYQCLDTLANKGLIDYSAVLGGHHSGRATLTAEGWGAFEQLIKGNLSYDKAFMAMKFNDEEINDVVENCFKPAVVQTGYKLFKLNDRPEAGLIDIRLRQEIKTSKFIIADLTHDNLGAYWEAGFAEGIGKKVIYTCKAERFEAAKTHFDVNHHLTIVWDTNNLNGAAEELKAAIRYTFPEAKQED